MLKAIKIRLYPNKEQQTNIHKLLGCYRFVYNKCLNLKIAKYNEDETSLNLKELGKYFHNELTKNPDFEWLNEQNTKVLKQSIMNMLDAYKRFFVNGSGFPKFKSKHDKQLSCRFPIEAISKKQSFENNKINLTKQLVGIKFRTSNKYKSNLIKYQQGIKSATLTKTKSGKYFLSILVDTDEVKQLPKTSKTVGIDLGIKDFVITSDNVRFQNIRIKRSNENKLAKLHRELSRKQKGSNNKNKARIRLAKFYEKLNNKKQNYLHEVANTLLNENQIISMEDLSVKGMMKNHKLARSIQELSLYKFKSILKYKAEWYGRDIVEIDRWFPSSKQCNKCGWKKVDLKLSDREWTCESCGTHHDRDHNSANNINDEGLRVFNETP